MLAKNKHILSKIQDKLKYQLKILFNTKILFRIIISVVTVKIYFVRI